MFPLPYVEYHNESGWFGGENLCVCEWLIGLGLIFVCYGFVFNL